jgi:hypothetical protein
MLEITALFVLFGLGMALLFFLALGWLLLKLVFKVVLLPITLALGLLKVAAVVVVGVLALLVAPVLLTVAAVLAIPLLALALFIGLGYAAFAAVG